MYSTKFSTRFYAILNQFDLYYNHHSITDTSNMGSNKGNFLSTNSATQKKCHILHLFHSVEEFIPWNVIYYVFVENFCEEGYG